MLLYLVMLAFPAAMVLAACFDLFTMKIPNWVTAGLAAAFPIAALATGMDAATALAHVTAGLTVLAIAFALFCPGWIGGGDAKLVAATALWLGWGVLPQYLLLASVLGGVLTLGILIVRNRLPVLPVRQEWLLRLHDRETGIPYGIALAASAMLILPQTPWMTMAAG